MKDTTADREIPVRNVEEARTLLGPLDSNARLIRELYGVNVLVRDGSLRLLGKEREVAQVCRFLENGLKVLRQGGRLTTGDVARMLRGNDKAFYTITYQIRYPPLVSCDDRRTC